MIGLLIGQYGVVILLFPGLVCCSSRTEKGD